ncbi:hypothetical protein TCON_0122 [Astathelohania contejeani]|uniref:Ricin B lectin domain-containing protein n=1 Tax=Astathelohania contejeani TaxID=164912 RepID=A0ABQ7I2K2_9MICR|nr:hypothetical protein TCON_0122 [Thelohania contejeani]
MVYASCITLYFQSKANEKYITTNDQGWLVLGDHGKAKRFSLRSGPGIKVFIQDEDKRVWDIEGRNSNAILYSIHEGDNQQFEIALNQNGTNFIYVMDSCLQFSNDDPMRIYRAPCDGSIAQEWKVMENLSSYKSTNTSSSEKKENANLNKGKSSSDSKKHDADILDEYSTTSDTSYVNFGLPSLESIEYDESSYRPPAKKHKRFHISDYENIECDESSHHHLKPVKDHHQHRKHHS